MPQISFNHLTSTSIAYPSPYPCPKPGVLQLPIASEMSLRHLTALDNGGRTVGFSHGEDEIEYLKMLDVDTQSKLATHRLPNPQIS